MEYQKALKFYPIAKALIQQAQVDAPNYRPASSINRCANCVHFNGQRCDLFDFAADPDYLCDSWEERLPDVGEIRALIEQAGARHSRGDNRMLQTIHDMSVQLGAVCKADDDDY